MGVGVAVIVACVWMWVSWGVWSVFVSCAKRVVCGRASGEGGSSRVQRVAVGDVCSCLRVSDEREAALRSVTASLAILGCCFRRVSSSESSSLGRFGVFACPMGVDEREGGMEAMVGVGWLIGAVVFGAVVVSMRGEMMGEVWVVGGCRFGNTWLYDGWAGFRMGVGLLCCWGWFV